MSAETEAELLKAAEAVVKWWDETLATKLLSHAEFPWAEDAEWDQFQPLRFAIKASTATTGDQS